MGTQKVDSALPLYLKKGSRIKKATIRSQDLILSNLRQLFERHYNMLVPESVIYILDPCSGVEYELENVDDVKPYSILSIKGKQKRERVFFFFTDAYMQACRIINLCWMK